MIPTYESCILSWLMIDNAYIQNIFDGWLSNWLFNERNLWILWLSLCLKDSCEWLEKMACCYKINYFLTMNLTRYGYNDIYFLCWIILSISYFYWDNIFYI